MLRLASEYEYEYVIRNTPALGISSASLAFRFVAEFQISVCRLEKRRRQTLAEEREGANQSLCVLIELALILIS